MLVFFIFYREKFPITLPIEIEAIMIKRRKKHDQSIANCNHPHTNTWGGDILTPPPPSPWHQSILMSCNPITLPAWVTPLIRTNRQLKKYFFSFKPCHFHRITILINSWFTNGNYMGSREL